MQTLKLHNPEVAAGSTLRNAVVETVSNFTDLSINGRLWYDEENNRLSVVTNGAKEVFVSATDTRAQTIASELTFSSSLTANSITNTNGILTDTINVTGTANIANIEISGGITGDSLTINNNATIGGTLDVTGATTLSDTLSVIGTSTTNGIINTGTITTDILTAATNINAGGNISATGSITATANLQAGGTLDVTGATTLSDTLSVTGATTLADKLDIAGNVTVGVDKTTIDAVTGNIATAGTLNVTGATTLSDTLSVAGATAIENELTVTGATTLSDTLEVKKATTTSGITNTGIITTNELTAYNVAVDGNIQADSLNVDNNVIIGGDQHVEGSVSISGDLVVSGSTTKVEIVSEQVNFADNVLLLNSNVVEDSDMTIAENVEAGLSVRRALGAGNGVTDTTFIKWNETSDQVEIIRDVDTTNERFEPIASGTDLTNLQNVVDTRINNVNTAVGIENDTYTANDGANFISTAVSLVDADNVLDTALKTEETSRIDADTVLDTRITTVENQINGTIGELTDLHTADQTNIVASINEVHDEMDANKAALADNTANQAGATLVGYESTLVDNTEAVDLTTSSTVQSAIDAIANGLNTFAKANTGAKFSVETTTAAKVHTITHNFNTQMISVDVQVQDPATSEWAFDLTVIDIIDNNNVQISLSQYANVRVFVESYV